MSTVTLFKTLTVGTSIIAGNSTEYRVFGESVLIKAATANSGVVRVSITEDVATQGFPLEAGAAVLIDVGDLNLLKLVASQAGQTVHLIVE